VCFPSEEHLEKENAEAFNKKLAAINVQMD
jgi:hypothetical protein